VTRIGYIYLMESQLPNPDALTSDIIATTNLDTIIPSLNPIVDSNITVNDVVRLLFQLEIFMISFNIVYTMIMLKSM
jgi:hypothetical protein